MESIEPYGENIGDLLFLEFDGERLKFLLCNEKHSTTPDCVRRSSRVDNDGRPLGYGRLFQRRNREFQRLIISRARPTV